MHFQSSTLFSANKAPYSVALWSEHLAETGFGEVSDWAIKVIDVFVKEDR